MLSTAFGLVALSGTVPAIAETAEKSDDIVVTAQRRAESVQDVPLAITAMGAEELKSKQIVDVYDLDRFAPGVQISENTLAAKITIRGVGSEAFNYGGDPGVAFHADDVYIGRSEAQTAAFFDVERVEVLRGPQGTLYGRNTTGGAINVIYQKPSQDPYGSLEAGFGNYNAYELRAVLNQPLGDKAAIRLGAMRRYNSGVTHNAVPNRKDVDDLDDYMFRAQLAVNPTDRLRILIQGEYYRDQRRGFAAKFLGGPDGASTPAEAPPWNGDTIVPISSRDVVHDVDPSEYKKIWSVTGKIDYETEIADIRSVTSYRSHKTGYKNSESDGTDAFFSELNIDQDIHQFSQEVQIVSNNDDSPISWILGGFYFNESGGFNRRIDFFAPTTVLFNGGDVKTESIAGFGRLEFKLSDRIKLFAGARYGKDTKTMDEFLRFVGIPFSGVNTNKDSWSDLTWDVGARFEIDRNNTVYAKVSRGAKSGGFNTGALQPTSFAPEYVTNYEAGYKGSFMGGRTRLSLVGFWSDYKDMQVSQVVDLAAQFNNAGQSTIKGLEFEAAVEPLDGFSINLNAAYIDATYDEFSSQDDSRPGKGLQNLKGNQIQNVAKYSLTIAPQYVHELEDGGSLRLTGAYATTSRIYFTPFNELQQSQKAVGRFDASITYVSPSKRWEVALWGKNLTNELVYGFVSVRAAATGSPSFASLEPPRTYGARVTWRFMQ